MADKKAVGHAYNIDFLNVVFAASSIVLLITVVWMVWDDFDREWKNYQRRFVRLETEVTQAGLQRAEQAIDANRLQTLETDLAAAIQEQETNQTRIAELDAQVADADVRLYRATQNYQFAKATYDVNRYAYEVRKRDDPSVEEADGADIAAQFADVTALNLQMQAVDAERRALAAELAAFTGRARNLQTEISELTAERGRLQARLAALEPSLVKNLVLNAPLLDFMAPTIKVRQVLTPNIVDDVNFTRVAKMDRCMTCHLAIDRAGYEEYPQPFRTHPDLELYVGGASPHPLESTGCTVCHEGMGQSITFVDAAHTPSDEEELHRWEAEYHWEEPHLWDYPMLEAGMTEASCAKCHENQIYVPDASNLNLAYGTYERAGCYACHKTKGFENLRKPGPDLTRIDAKLTPAWVTSWLRDPRGMKANTWMPKFWYTANSNAPADVARNEAEIDAVTTYLFANSGAHEFAVAAPPRGDAVRGQQIVQSVGCLGCHILGDESRAEAGPRRTFGQPLVGIGGKTSYEWLYDWVRDPKHYSPSTYMPDLRLTDDEVANVASYLSGLEGPAGVAAPAAVTAGDTDAALLDYLSAVVPAAEAEAMLATMDAEARKLELGQRVILRYGCFSCHEIKGFEGAQQIGIELSEEGSKLLPQLDFAFQHIPHTKVDWFKQKMRSPRSYDENRVLQPLERLRMPDFGFSEAEAKLAVTAIMSFQRDVQPKAAWQSRTARVDALTEGRALVRRRNCVACHVIEGDGGDYLSLVADPSLGPPLLTPEGAKVKPDWLYAFLRGPITIRPWLDVRMPSFNLEDSHWNTAIDYFAAVSDTVGPFRTPDVASRSASDLRTGQELFELLRCQQCHVLGTLPADQPTENLAPDLRMAQERLQPDWIIDWLRVPSRIQPGTRMPAFWPDHPASFYPQFDNDAAEQIRIIRDYLLTFRGGPNPKVSSSAN